MENFEVRQSNNEKILDGVLIFRNKIGNVYNYDYIIVNEKLSNSILVGSVLVNLSKQKVFTSFCKKLSHNKEIKEISEKVLQMTESIEAEMF